MIYIVLISDMVWNLITIYKICLTEVRDSSGGGSRISPGWGRQSSRKGANTWFCPVSPRKLHEIERICMPGMGAHPWCASLALDPPMLLIDFNDFRKYIFNLLLILFGKSQNDSSIANASRTLKGHEVWRARSHVRLHKRECQVCLSAVSWIWFMPFLTRKPPQL